MAIPSPGPSPAGRRHAFHSTPRKKGRLTLQLCMQAGLVCPRLEDNNSREFVKYRNSFVTFMYNLYNILVSYSVLMLKIKFSKRFNLFYMCLQTKHT